MAVQDAGLVDLLNIEGNRRAARVLIATSFVIALTAMLVWGCSLFLRSFNIGWCWDGLRFLRCKKKKKGAGLVGPGVKEEFWRWWICY